MPIPEGYKTEYIVKNLEKSINRYNKINIDYNKYYQKYLFNRNKFLTNYEDIADLLVMDEFIDEIIRVLDEFGMNARLSELVSKGKFFNVMNEMKPLFSILSRHRISITDINLKEKCGSNNIYDIIREIYNTFSKRGNLTISGGFVIASKTMHFIMPDLFIMIDGEHIGLSLYNVDDYMPHKVDGKNWYEAVPNYSGKKPNPSPRGAGRMSWDAERYCIALLYYKRIWLEWMELFNNDKNGFLALDYYKNNIPRIIDKSLW